MLTFLSGALGGPVRALLPVYVEARVHAPPSFTSLLLSLLLVGGGVCAMVGGALADRLGQKRTLVLGMTSLICSAGLFLVGDPGVLVALALAAGLIGGLQIVGGQAYLVAATPAGQIGVASALFFLGSTFGTSLGSLGAGALVERWGFGAFGAVVLVSAALLTTMGGRMLPELLPTAPPVRSAMQGALGSFGSLVRQREMVLIGCVRFLPTCYWGVATVVVPLLLYRLSGSVLGASLYAAVSLAVAAPCQLLTGRLNDRLGLGRPLVVLTALIPIVALAAALGTRSYALLFAAGVFGTAVAWSVSVNFPPLVRQLTAPGEHGQALGLLHGLWVAAMIIGATAGGALVDVDPAMPFLLTAALNVPTAIAGLALRRRLEGTVCPIV